MPFETATSFDNATILPRPVLRISYDERQDFLTALVPGAVVDGQLADEVEALLEVIDEDGDEVEVLWLYMRGPNGPLIGFGAAGAFAWDPTDVPDDSLVWTGPRFDVPSLALRGATIGEILLAARRTLDGSTPDVLAFDLAVKHGTAHEWDEAEKYWRACLATGEMKGHYGLGYTLVELDRPREAFGHLAMYTEICPRNAWGWVWRGRAAQAMGELTEARRSWERALEAEQEDGAFETDAAELLEALDRDVAP